MTDLQQEWIAVSSLLDEALELPAHEHAAWLDALPPGSQRLRPVLARLLSEESLRNRIDGLPSLHDGSEQPGSPGIQADPGQVVAGYRLIRLLGQGGMGSVWLAQRDSGPLARRVALKLPHVALSSAAMIGRFDRECAILSALNHPHIARLYDAGRSETGQPYLALEYVEGVALTAYCDSAKLSIADRIGVFRQVLAAVQHAHGQLVVHRDIKPANILVSAKGEVKLLDFGIAKLVHDSGEATELTRLGGRVLTLEYASPEQAAGQPIGVSSDIYSLGVVLYELLTGELPYRSRRGSALDLERALVHGDLRMASAVPISGTNANARRSTAQRVRRQLAGDLEAVVMSALRTVPQERYPTCDAFAFDLTRYLRGQPVFARPVGPLNRAVKFMRRHWIGASAAAAVCAALLAGSTVAIWQARAAREQAQIAATEAARARREQALAVAVKDFLIGIFRVNDPAYRQFGGTALTAGGVLAAGAARLRYAFEDQPETKSELYETLIGILDGMDEFDLARKLAGEYLEFTDRRFGAGSTEVVAALLREASVIAAVDADGARRDLARAETVLNARGDRNSITRAQLLVHRGTLFSDASDRTVLDEARHGVELLVASHAPRSVQAEAMGRIAQRYLRLLDLDVALAWYAKAIGTASGYEGAELYRANMLAEMSEIWFARGRIEQGRATLREAMEALTLLPESHPQHGRLMVQLGGALHGYGERREGRDWIKRGVSILQLAYGEHSAPTLQGTKGYEQDLMDGTIAAYGAAVAWLQTLARTQAETGSVGEALTRVVLARWHMLAGQYRHARAELEQAERLARPQSAPQGALWLSIHVTGARLALREGARPEVRRRIDLLAAVGTDGNQGAFVIPLYHARMEIERARELLLLKAELAVIERRMDKAAKLVRSAAALGSAPGETYLEEDEARIARALGVALRSSDPAAACDSLRRAVRIYERYHDPASPPLAATRASAGRCAGATKSAAPASAKASSNGTASALSPRKASDSD